MKIIPAILLAVSLAGCASLPHPFKHHHPRPQTHVIAAPAVVPAPAPVVEPAPAPTRWQRFRAAVNRRHVKWVH
jgi:hypothetical protein